MIQSLIKQAIDETNTVNCYYAGGTLFMDVPGTLLVININGQKFSYCNGADRKMSNTEMYYACKCYLKYKEPGHAHYQKAKDFIEQYEK